MKWIKAREIEKFNLTHMKLTPSTGADKRELKKAKEWRNLKHQVKNWPRTMELFELLAEDCEAIAKHQEKDSKLRKMKYE